MTLTGIGIHQVVDRQMVEGWGCFDTLNASLQLGATITLPAEAVGSAVYVPRWGCWSAVVARRHRGNTSCVSRSIGVAACLTTRSVRSFVAGCV